MFRHPFRTTRNLIIFCSVTGISLSALIAVVTGFIPKAVAFVDNAINTVSGWIDGFIAWIHQPFDLSHLLAAGSVVVVPLIFIVIFLVITDN